MPIAPRVNILYPSLILKPFTGAKDALFLCFDSNVNLPNHYYSSLVQFEKLERRLSKDPELRESYAYTNREDNRKGYVVTVESHDPRTRSDREWYLPHHPVVKPNKPVKVRRVLNGAFKFHCTSFKKSLMMGPDLHQKLSFVLLRFRQHKYTVSAHVKGMFLQVGVLARDQVSLRFLWREDTTSDVVVHQYARHIFGARDSSTYANFALRKTATDNMSTYPEAASVVTENFTRTLTWIRSKTLPIQLKLAAILFRLNFTPIFVARGYHFRCGSSSVHSRNIRRSGFAYVRQFRVAKNSN